MQEKLNQDQAAERHSCSVIAAMSPEITKEDIAALVFHWTTLDKFNGCHRE